MSAPSFEIRRFDEIDSTNTYLVSQAHDGAPDGLVLLAGHQTAGRGRLGRTWEAPPGASLLASILFRVPLGPDRLYLASAAVSISAIKAIETLTGVTASLKWPNDLVIDNKKVAGILAEIVETRTDGSNAESCMVVGIGINLIWPGPPDVGGTSLLESTGRNVDPESMLKALLAELTGRNEALRDPARQERLAQEFVEHLGTLGTQVRIELPDEDLIARAVGVSPEGHLIVESDAGTREIVTGDVVHVRPHL